MKIIMIKRTNAILFLLLFTISTNANSQSLKVYSGSYEHGTATYQYYENKDYERIFQGNISYKSKGYDISYYEEEIVGSFKQNLKNGLWTSKKVRTLTDSKMGELKISVIFSGQYENGKKVGQWTYKTQARVNEKNGTTSATCNFNDNVLVGSVNLASVKGQLSNEGLYIGNWTMTTNKYGEGQLEYIALFKNNIFLKLIVRQISDGKILFRYDNSDLVNQITEIVSPQIVKINGQGYMLKSCSNLNKYSNDDNKYFSNFYVEIEKLIRNIEEPLEDISLGSTASIIKTPQLLLQN